MMLLWHVASLGQKHGKAICLPRLSSHTSPLSFFLVVAVCISFKNIGTQMPWNASVFHLPVFRNCRYCLNSSQEGDSSGMCSIFPGFLSERTIAHTSSQAVWSTLRMFVTVIMIFPLYTLFVTHTPVSAAGQKNKPSPMLEWLNVYVFLELWYSKVSVMMS